jgi:hypothetical protein
MPRRAVLGSVIAILGWLSLAACSTDGEPAQLSASPETSTSGREPEAASTTATTHTPETTTVTPDEGCRRLTDFDDCDVNDQWVVVNDNVMGGRSEGALSFEDGLLIFEGEINTNGGGFSSLRFPLEPLILEPFDRIEFRARPDGRTYMVTFEDSLASRDPRVSHRAPIGFGAPGEWQSASVSFDEPRPAIFGTPITDEPFRKDLASQVGLMIADGVDGPFRLEIDSIDLCPS